jgi:hypothetical protein
MGTDDERDRSVHGAVKGEPYLGLWAGFYQSFANKGRVRVGAVAFFINDLGLRCRATEGNFMGEGPALATRARPQLRVLGTPGA